MDRNVKRWNSWAAIAALIMVVAATGCSGPTPPEPEPLGPAAIISLDSVTTGPGTVHVPLRLTYTAGAEDRLDTPTCLRFLVSYDATVLNFSGDTDPGEAIAGWPSFDVEAIQQFTDSDSTVRGVRVIADRNGQNGGDHRLRDGIIATLAFQVPYHLDFAGVTTVVGFGAQDCTDNTISPESDRGITYMADTAYGRASHDAIAWSAVCERHLVFEPVLGFANGVVQIEDFDDPYLAAIVSVESISVSSGSWFDVPVTIRYPKYPLRAPVRLGGFDLLVVYDSTAMQFAGPIEKGLAITSWEYINARNGPMPDCGSCPLKTVRVVSIRDTNNGIVPNPPQDHPEGMLATLRFQSASDPALAGTSYDIGFMSLTCEDNVLEDISGNTHFFADQDYAKGDPRAVTATRCPPRLDQSFEWSLGFCRGRVYIVAP